MPAPSENAYRCLDSSHWNARDVIAKRSRDVLCTLSIEDACTTLPVSTTKNECSQAVWCTRLQ
eukprot:2783648-Pyramimonas_sp.AAC.1